MSKRCRLHDPEFPDDPVDAFLQNDGMILLEGEDGDQVALSQVELKQLIEWLEQARVELEQARVEEDRVRTANALAEWNALSQREAS